MKKEDGEYPADAGNSGFTIACDGMRGAIKGNVTIRDSVALKGRASVTGDIRTQTLSMENGVKMNGRLDMGQPE